MLKHIPAVLSPRLVEVLDEMGNGDWICIGDGNYPGASLARAGKSIYLRADGIGGPQLLEAILELMPLDGDCESPVILMEKSDKDKNLDITVWKEYERILADHEERGKAIIGKCEKQEFYERSKDAYCILQSGETAIYGNIMLRKGIVFP